MEKVGAFKYDEVLGRLKIELDAVIARKRAHSSSN
jgi:hypothetical protein